MRMELGQTLKMRTARHRCENGNERVVKLLLENSARPDFQNADGKTPGSHELQKRVVREL
jgi:ankyrin repeat protein